MFYRLVQLLEHVFYIQISGTKNIFRQKFQELAYKLDFAGQIRYPIYIIFIHVFLKGMSVLRVCMSKKYACLSFEICAVNPVGTVNSKIYRKIKMRCILSGRAEDLKTRCKFRVSVYY